MNSCKSYYAFAIYFLFFSLPAQAAAEDSLVIVTNKTLFQKGDTLRFDAYLPYVVDMHLQTATLNVWIEDVNKVNQWKFRFPIVNGRMSADIAIDQAIPDGKYAVNFLVQRGLWQANGKIMNINRQHSELVYFLSTKAGSSHNTIAVNPDGSFHTSYQVFEDTANLIFTPVSTNKKTTNDLKIELESPLDSAFTPVISATKIIFLGDQPANTSSGNNKYSFDLGNFKGDHQLEEVIIAEDKKTEVEKFQDEFVSGLFSSNNARVFDGLENQEMTQFGDIFSYLQGKMAGLTINNNNTGGYSVSWRGSATDFYLNELAVSADDMMTVNPNDIAMIKVFSPPAMLSGGGGSGSGGAIAVYTKRGKYGGNSIVNNTDHQYFFIVHGFSPLNAVWKW